MKRRMIQKGKRERQGDGKYKKKVTKQEGWNGKVQPMPVRTPGGETREVGREASLKNG